MKIRHFFYFLFASLVFVACKEDDPVEPTPEITGLDFTITTYDDQPLAVGVTPTATGAESFKIYFDSVGDPDTFQETTGALVTHTYVTETTTTYTIKVVASNSNGAADVELTKDHTATVVPPTNLADFESSNPPFFSDDLTVVAEGHDGNTTAVGKQTQLDGGLYDSFTIINAKYVDLTEKAVISFDFWQETAATPKLALKMEGVVEDGLYDVEVSVTAEAVAGWQTVSFDFENDRANSYPNNEQPLSDLGTYVTIVGFIGFGEEVPGTFYIDNVQGAEFGDDIPDTDGDGSIDPIDSCPDTAGVEEFDGCPAGPSVAAAAPTLDAADVISYFSDTYTDESIATWASQYSVNAAAEVVEIAGNNTLKFTISAAGGYALSDLATVTDVSSKNALHMDVWSATSDAFTVKVVDYGPNQEFGTGAPNYAPGGDDSEVAYTFDLVQGWNSINIPQTGTTTNFAQFVFTHSESGVFFVDNVYFYYDSAFDTCTATTVELTLKADGIGSATSVRIAGPWWGFWDPNAGPVATKQADGSWKVTLDSVPTDNMEYLWVVDGTQESLVDNAANDECTSKTASGNLITDRANYANRVWLTTDSLCVVDVYDSCQ